MRYPDYIALPLLTWSNTFSKCCSTFNSELECRWLRTLQALRKIILRVSRNSIFSHSCHCKIERRIIFHFIVKVSIIMISDICKLALWQTAESMATISSAYLKTSLQMIELYKWYRCLLYLQM